MQINKQRRKNSVKECYLKENNHEDKTVKDTKKCDTQRKFKFKDYNSCLKASQIKNIIHCLEKK